MNSGFSKNQIIAVGGIVCVVITVVAVALIMLNTPIYIRNMGTSVEQNGAIVNTITVAGDGKVTVQPDMATITFTVSELADTSEQALANANVKINQVTDILKNNGVAQSDIKTSQFSIYPEYDYSISGNSTIKGQRASIGVTVDIKGIDATASKATKIIDEVAKIDKIQLGSISFDLENKEAAFSKAREAAYNKAKQKAEDLARLSGVKLLKPVSVTDYSNDVSSPAPIALNATASVAEGSKSTSLSTGDLELSISVNVIFGIE